MAHHVFFHLNEENEGVGLSGTKRYEGGEDSGRVCTHELIPDELPPFLFLSPGGDQGTIPLKYPLQPDVSFAGLLEYV